MPPDFRLKRGLSPISSPFPNSNKNSDMTNPDPTAVRFDGETFALSMLGKIPIVGDVYKDQIQNHIFRVEVGRMQEALERVRAQLSDLKERNFTPENLKIIDNMCVTTIQRVRAEGLREKRDIYADILAQTIKLSLEPARMDWFQRAIERLSMMSIEVFRVILQSTPRANQQIHSHSGIMSDLETKLGYSYLVALLRELEAVGTIDLRIDQSSVVGGNARFIVFWKSLGDDFSRFITRKK